MTVVDCGLEQGLLPDGFKPIGFVSLEKTQMKQPPFTGV